MENSLSFKNGKFKIMQIADVQEKANVNPDTIKLITLVVQKEKPDLVVFTGDQITGYSASFKKNTREKIENVIKQITAPLSENNIPFCVTFGNHDRDCGISNKTQMNEIYKNLPGIICPASADQDDTGTYSLQIKNSDKTKNIFNLYIIDSNAKEPDGTYSPVSKKQVEWYKNEREKIKHENGDYLPSLVFQHIPLPEFYNILKRCKHFTKGAVEAFYSHKNEFYILGDKGEAGKDFMLESPAAPDINNGEFDAMKEKGEVLGIFVGHDHNNSFVKELDSIKLGYTQGCGFNTYGPGKNRGVRMFILDENDLNNFETYTVTMQELCSYKPSKPALEFVLTHAPTSVKQVKRIVSDAAIVTGVALTATAIIKKIIK